jgi:hypothetical protein
MAEKKVSANEALELAKGFRDASTKLGDVLYENWASIAPKERDKLRSLEVTLLNLSTDLVTQAVGIVLDDAKAGLKELGAATTTAKKAIAKIENVKKVINVVTALIGLAAAIPTGNIGSIVSAVKNVQEAAKGKPGKKDETANEKAAAKSGKEKVVT